MRMRGPKWIHWLCHPCSSLALHTMQDPRKAILCPQPYLSLDSSETPSPHCSPFSSQTPAAPSQGKGNEAGSSGILPGPPWPGMTSPLCYTPAIRRILSHDSSCVSSETTDICPQVIWIRSCSWDWRRTDPLPCLDLSCSVTPSPVPHSLGLAFTSSLHHSGKLQRTWLLVTLMCKKLRITNINQALFCFVLFCHLSSTQQIGTGIALLIKPIVSPKILDGMTCWQVSLNFSLSQISKNRAML